MICIAWGGMPAYAECAVSQFILDSKEDVCIISTPSDVPKTCNDLIAGHKINWVSDNDTRSLIDIIHCYPRVLFVSGWFIPSFNRFVKEARAHKVKIIAGIDNRYNLSIRQLLWLIKFKFMRKPMFDGFIVPGESGQRLLKFGGVKQEIVKSGLYTANPELFKNTKLSHLRAKRMIFVGRFTERKNVMRLIRAFVTFSNIYKDWTLDCYGQGDALEEMNSYICKTNNKQIFLHSFIQPNELAKIYQETRVMILPSLEDHWGVVVHEAALTGNALILSKNVGALEDFVRSKGCLSFHPKDERTLSCCFATLAQWTDEDWDTAQKETLQIASTFSPRRFSQGFKELLNRF